MDMSHLALLWIAVFAGGFTQGLAGFGSTLIALPVLAMVFELRFAVPLASLVALGLNAVMIVRLRGHARYRPLALLAAAAVPGMPLGAWLLRVAPADGLKIALALAIAGFLLFQARPGGRGGPAGTGWGLVAGFVSGCMGGAIGINGPPAVAWIMRLGLDRDGARATLVTYFFVVGCGVVASQGLAGLVTGRAALFAALSLPALLAGIYAGMACCGRISEAAFRRVVNAVLLLNAVTLLWQGIAGSLAGVPGLGLRG